jgi:hypothetical protein
MSRRQVDDWINRQAAKRPLVTGLLFGLLSGGLSLLAQLGNPHPRPLWALAHFVIWFVFGVVMGRRARRMQAP